MDNNMLRDAPHEYEQGIDFEGQQSWLVCMEFLMIPSQYLRLIVSIQIKIIKYSSKYEQQYSKLSDATGC